MMLRALGPVVLLLLVGCGGAAEPPPRVAEVPIDETQPAEDTPPASSAAPDSSGSATAASASEDSSGGAAGTPAPAKTGKSGGGPGPAPRIANPGKSGPIVSAKECSELSDKGIELMAFGDGGPLKGHTGKQMEQELSMIKQMAVNDPNFAKMKSECAKTVHRSQYDCGMKARSSAEWQDCVR